MSISWEIKNNVISRVFFNGVNIIYPWGFETADSSAFFSLESGVGWRYECIEESYYSDDNKNISNITIKMKEGKWNLMVIDEIVSESKILRKVEAECLEKSIFMDFVLRYRFKKEFFKIVKISDRKIYHKNSNIYYQYPVDRVSLIGENINVKIKVIDSIVPNKMNQVMYVRDSGNEWIVHARMLPKYYDKEVIKICTNWAKTRPLPSIINNILLKSKKIKNYLWYRGEFSPINKNIILKLFNPSAYPMVKLERGTKLMWKVEIDII